jgi:leader peptidase (prepilin peptidase)/N-methyltransferase
MLLLYFLGELFGRIMAKRRGEPIEEVALGFGDVNLSGVLGLLLGWPGITAGLIFAILAGGLVSAFILARMMLRKEYQAFTALPYAPFLILAGVVFLFRP